MKKYKPSEVLGIKEPGEILESVRSWSSNLSKKEHLIKSAVLEIHQNCELRLDRIINKLLTYNAPLGFADKEIEVSKNEIWNEIGRMSFLVKVKLLRPMLKAWKQTNPSLTEINEINEVRNACAHMTRKDKSKVVYKGYKLFEDDEGIARLFLDGWGINQGLDSMWELIDENHGRAERAIKFAWGKKAL